MWSSDHFGWPITARPYASTSTRQFVEISEVMNQIVRRACLFNSPEVKKPTVPTTTTTATTTITTASRRSKAEEIEVEKELIASSYSYSDLVSLVMKVYERL